MTSSVAVRSLPAQKKTKANGMPVGDEARMNQLQNLTGNGKVPAYMKLVIELLLETRMEIKTANHKNAELVEEIRLLREENSALKLSNTSLKNSELDVKNAFAITSFVPGNEEQGISRSIVLSSPLLLNV
ncbi:hypothetical protein Aduo_015510 [Ancylostoma duodenale]